MEFENMLDAEQTGHRARVVLVGIAHDSGEYEKCRLDLDELSRLADTAGGDTVARVIQIKDTPDPATCIGRGKVDEVREICEREEATLVIFDVELSPTQIRNVEDILDGPDVIDRTMLILDIFALHAKTGEGKLQVELAQLRYTAPRLVGRGLALSRQEGRIGTRGPGESKLESDKRHIKRRIISLERQIEEMDENRAVMRASRDRSGLVKVAIVGYTNAGKSTLLNRLTDAGVLAEDKLFATLDPTTRKLKLPGGETILLTDTVGFINKLPHQLVKAFRSTLDEVKYADIILVICDASDPEAASQLETTYELLGELGAGGKPTLLALNKCDKIENNGGIFMAELREGVFISASNGYGIDDLLARLRQEVEACRPPVTFRFSYTEQGKVSDICRRCRVENTEYLDEYIEIRAFADEISIGMYRNYIVGGAPIKSDDDEE